MTMTEKKPALAVSHYFEELEEEGRREEKANKGYVWTMLVNGTSRINVLGLAGCDYTLNLNCSHVGETVYGVYRGELSMKFDGDISGVKALLRVALGLGTQEDVNGWFRNDKFVMKLKPYDSTDEEEFLQTLPKDAIESQPETGDANKDAAAALVTGMVNKFINAVYSAASDNPQEPSAPSGLWYDWDFHMTDGDMGTFIKLNGGTPLWHITGHAETNAAGELVTGDSTVTTIFTGPIKERYDEPLYSPFPYSIKVYPDSTVIFTLYNTKGPVSVGWIGNISRIRVEDTVTV